MEVCGHGLVVIFFWNFLGGTEEKCEKQDSQCSSQDLNCAPFEYKLEVLLFDPACLFSLIWLLDNYNYSYFMFQILLTLTLSLFGNSLTHKVVTVRFHKSKH
jgi:hypothetical protein